MPAPAIQAVSMVAALEVISRAFALTGTTSPPLCSVSAWLASSKLLSYEVSLPLFGAVSLRPTDC